MGIKVIFLIFFLGSSWAAYPAEEFLFDGFYAAEKSPGKYADVTGLKWKRVNKTAFQFSGSVTLLTDIDDTISVISHVLDFRSMILKELIFLGKSFVNWRG